MGGYSSIMELDRQEVMDAIMECLPDVAVTGNPAQIELQTTDHGIIVILIMRTGVDPKPDEEYGH